MNDYYLKMKGFTESLIDLDVDVPNRVLVLNVLHRLNKAFNHLHAHNTFSFFPPTVLPPHPRRAPACLDNSCTRSFLLTHGVLLRMLCPYTSPQNGKTERIIRSTNNVMRSLLFQAMFFAFSSLLISSLLG
jgi:hypothetical protein